MKYAYLSDIGRRELNEDSIGAESLSLVLQSKRKDIHVFIIADGMGGVDKGEIASKLAVCHVVAKFIERSLTEDPIAALENAIKDANGIIFEFARNSGFRHIGTTIVVAVFDEQICYIANVGDSRAYLINNQDIEQISKDHSAVQEMVDKGEISLAEAQDHPYRSYITRCVGYEPQVKVDTYRLRVFGDDRLLLCSDGLTNRIDEGQLKELATKCDDLEEVCKGLVSVAKQRGESDNISVIVIQPDQLKKKREILEVSTKSITS